MKLTLRIFSFITLSFLLIQSCNKNGIRAVGSIASLNVTSGPYNTTVVITGAGFSSYTLGDQVFFNGKTATITGATGTQLTVLVPLGAGTGPVTVIINGGQVITGPVFTYQQTAVVSTIATINNTNTLWGIVVDAAGNVYTTDLGNNLVEKITPAGVVSNFAVNIPGQAPFFTIPVGMIQDASGNFYVANATNIVKITATGSCSTIPVTQSNSLFAIAMDAAGNFYTADYYKYVIYKTTPAGVTTVFAGSGAKGSTDGTGTAASFSYPTGLTIDAAGNLYDVDEGATNLIRKITPAGVVTTIAGNGTAGKADGKGTAASFNSPTGAAVDAGGNLYIADTFNNLIRKITPDGTVTTIAGSGSSTEADGIGTSASFKLPECIAIDAAGNLYVTDAITVRKITFQ